VSPLKDAKEEKYVWKQCMAHVMLCVMLPHMVQSIVHVVALNDAIVGLHPLQVRVATSGAVRVLVEALNQPVTILNAIGTVRHGQ
jgi:hypothetical protein